MSKLPSFFYLVYGKIDSYHIRDGDKDVVYNFRNLAKNQVTSEINSQGNVDSQRVLHVLEQYPGAIPSESLYPQAKKIAQACLRLHFSGNSGDAQESLNQLLNYLSDKPKAKGFGKTHPVFLLSGEVQDIVLVGFKSNPNTDSIPVAVLHATSFLRT